VHVEIPMDIQAEAAEATVHDLGKRIPAGVTFPDPAAISAAAEIMRQARRPVLVAGGGAITANAAPDIRRLCEAAQIPVVTTWNGKGVFPEDHPLFAGSVGQTGTTAGNALASSADVVLAVGCRFTDWSASSYRQGVSFSIPPGRLIHIDVEAQEIGKNYPARSASSPTPKPQ